jgi:hypothetical protein
VGSYNYTQLLPLLINVKTPKIHFHKSVHQHLTICCPQNTVVPSKIMPGKNAMFIITTVGWVAQLV